MADPSRRFVFTSSMATYGEGNAPFSEEDELMLMTEGGRLVRTRVTEISLLGRNTQGVRLIDLSEQESLISVGLIEEAKEDI